MCKNRPTPHPPPPNYIKTSLVNFGVSQINGVIHHMKPRRHSSGASGCSEHLMNKFLIKHKTLFFFNLAAHLWCGYCKRRNGSNDSQIYFTRLLMVSYQSQHSSAPNTTGTKPIYISFLIPSFIMRCGNGNEWMNERKVFLTSGHIHAKMERIENSVTEIQGTFEVYSRVASKMIRTLGIFKRFRVSFDSTFYVYKPDIHWQSSPSPHLEKHNWRQ